MHPLYHHARRLVGRPVYIHHVTGQVYMGTLHSVTHNGIYVMPNVRGAGLGMASLQTQGALSVDASSEKQANIELVYSPGWYFGWGALAGLSAAAIAAPFFW
ncbi:hypothetical protein [Alicyclobacillus sp. ALC3]|uniref:hypothetical protein n=1 Tax=Alicyclobacillus sp. ALC3 TaxID=2796143 RepID=UPI0023796C8A|nr:hypothetical protein [Alicyclobacillus sp. ALC3]WDL96851.1 hypothetical protein JC200_21600 [Alicyclobacillus sp. ALC3]